jgi:hypothetical protein
MCINVYSWKFLAWIELPASRDVPSCERDEESACCQTLWKPATNGKLGKVYFFKVNSFKRFLQLTLCCETLTLKGLS